MYRVPAARAWWPAVGAPVERPVRQRLSSTADATMPGARLRLHLLRTRESSQAKAVPIELPSRPNRRQIGRVRTAIQATPESPEYSDSRPSHSCTRFRTGKRTTAGSAEIVPLASLGGVARAAATALPTGTAAHARYLANPYSKFSRASQATQPSA
jgi:hypothetical protein